MDETCKPPRSMMRDFFTSWIAGVLMSVLILGIYKFWSDSSALKGFPAAETHNAFLKYLSPFFFRGITTSIHMLLIGILAINRYRRQIQQNLPVWCSGAAAVFFCSGTFFKFVFMSFPDGLSLFAMIFSMSVSAEILALNAIAISTVFYLHRRNIEVPVTENADPHAQLKSKLTVDATIAWLVGVASCAVSMSIYFNFVIYSIASSREKSFDLAVGLQAISLWTGLLFVKIFTFTLPIFLIAQWAARNGKGEPTKNLEKYCTYTVSILMTLAALVNFLFACVKGSCLHGLFAAVTGAALILLALGPAFFVYCYRQRKK